MAAERPRRLQATGKASHSHALERTSHSPSPRSSHTSPTSRIAATTWRTPCRGCQVLRSHWNSGSSVPPAIAR
ncbi:hypothetical protein [Roseateles sp.]|uniref:hypothetical protein n=1 Tax=Roseateles sp. TaxID=1971397 RepID=UPI003BAB7307